MQTAVEMLQHQCYFWQYLVCFIFYFLLPLSLHSIIYFSGKQKNALSHTSQQLCSLGSVWAVFVCSILENVRSLEMIC